MLVIAAILPHVCARRQGNVAAIATFYSLRERAKGIEVTPHDEDSSTVEVSRRFATSPERLFDAL
jgi:hypothetical protein